MSAAEVVRGLALLSQGRRRGRGIRATTRGLSSSGPQPCALRVAAFVSPALNELGRRLGFPLAVVVTTKDPEAHLAQLVERQHASWCLGEDWIFEGVGGREIDPLQPAFEQLKFDPRWMGRRRLPSGVAIESGSLLITLPDSSTHARFAAELRSLLERRRFDVYGARPGAVLQRRATGRPLVVAPRYSCVWHGNPGSTAFEKVRDLYAFRPKNFPALIAAVVSARDRTIAIQTFASLIQSSGRA